MSLLPISTIIPTLNRTDRLLRTLASLLAQDVLPAEIIIVDASSVPVADSMLENLVAGLASPPRIICIRPTERGAAVQRNQGFTVATQPYILFADDDIDLEPGCLAALWQNMQSDPKCGGCGVVITNQHYAPPGRVMRTAYRLLGCPAEGSLAGRCCGPALNFLPAPQLEPMRSEQSVDWLNLCCTLYRRTALPQPPLLPFFHGYSLMEDAALALAVGRNWKLTVPLKARLFHDSQPANYKNRAYAREKMEMVNRWFVMRRIVGRTGLLWDLRQLAFQFFMLALSLRTQEGWLRFPAAVAGKVAGFFIVVLHGRSWRGYPPSLKA